MNDIVWLTMRRMRTPLIIMILVYSFSVFGMLAIPGQDEAGNPVRVGFLDASYFVAIMATTIGFGEVPNTFTAAQRLYTYAILFPNVIAWLYSIGTIISLFVDPQFRAVLALSRFSRNVRRIRGDYYIVCGFGYTGRMIVSGLLRRNINAAVLEREESIIHSMVELVDGTYDDAYAASMEHVRAHGGLSRNTAYNPLTMEGKKTVALEIAAQLGVAHVVEGSVRRDGDRLYRGRREIAANVREFDLAARGGWAGISASHPSPIRSFRPASWRVASMANSPVTIRWRRSGRWEAMTGQFRAT